MLAPTPLHHPSIPPLSLNPLTPPGARKQVGGDVFRVTLHMVPGTSASLRPLLHRLRKSRQADHQARQRLGGGGGRGEEGGREGEGEGARGGVTEREGIAGVVDEMRARRVSGGWGVSE